MADIFRNFLNKDANWFWSDEHEKTFTKMNEEMRKGAELPHLERDRKLRTYCEASKEG